MRMGVVRKGHEKENRLREREQAPERMLSTARKSNCM